MNRERVAALWITHSRNAQCRKSQSVNESDGGNEFIEKNFWLPILANGGPSNVTSLRYLYVAENGVAVLASSAFPVQLAEALQNPSHMLYFTYWNDFKIVLAPLWMRSTLSSPSNSSVCVESINSITSENRAQDFAVVDAAIKSRFSQGFETLFMTVVTWKNIITKWKIPHIFNSGRERLTFQLILATDFKTTYILMSYDELRVTSRNSDAEFLHAHGPAVFKGTVKRMDSSNIKDYL